jgi:Family of unknown function (DUF6077)
VSSSKKLSSTLARLCGALDFLSDWAVLCFASWTLFAYIGMATDANVTLLVALWLVTTPFLAALLLVRGVREGRAPTMAEPGRAALERNRWALFAGLGGGALSAILAAGPYDVPWPVVWLPALIAAAAVLAAGKVRSPAPEEPPGEARWGADVVAVLVALCFSVMSLVMFRPNPDDAFYVNRATATAQLGHIPVLDVIFTHEEVARGGGAGLPVDSYSALQGALARLLGLEAPTIAYLVFPPVFTFLATWALWRLVRAWAPRRLVLCFALGSVFWTWSAQFPLTSGSYFLNRIWQGKVAFVAWLMPTAYVYMTRWLGERNALTVVLLLAAGFASLGMTGTATFVAPLLFLVAVIPLAARGEWRAAVVPAVAGLIPFVIGIVMLLKFPLAETVGEESLHAQSWFYQQAVGTAVVGAIAAIGVWAAPWFVRAGPAERLASALALLFALLTAPGVVMLLHDVSGLTGTLRRVFWIVPFPALVALLAAIPLPRIRLVPTAAALAVAALLVVFGQPLWTLAGRTLWDYPPRWKVWSAPRARAVLAHYEGRGPILAPGGLMQTIAITTADPKVVNARKLYLRRTHLTWRGIHDRLLLTRFINRGTPAPPDSAVKRALAALQVGLVCVGPRDLELVPVVERLGPYREAFTTHDETCLVREGQAAG